MKKKLVLTFVISCLLSYPLISFAQSGDYYSSLFPYTITFSNREIKILNSLSTSTIDRLVGLSKMIYSKNFGNISMPASSTNALSNTLSLPSNLSQIQRGDFSNPFLPRDQTPLSNLLSGQQSQGQSFSPDSTPANYNPNQPVDNRPPQQVSYDRTFVESDGGDCSDFGVKITGGSCGYGPNDMAPKLKLDFRNLCRLTKKKMNITNSRRESSCTGKQEFFHSGGRAFDSDFTPFSEAEKTIIVLYFMAHQYNGIGGYGPTGKGNGAPHFDIRNYTMRWGPSRGLSSCAPGNYPSYVQRAFQEVGVPACNVNISPSDMQARAIAALKRLGKDEFAK